MGEATVTESAVPTQAHRRAASSFIGDHEYAERAAVERWVLTGDDMPDDEVDEDVAELWYSTAKLIADTEERARAAEREACAVYAERFVGTETLRASMEQRAFAATVAEWIARNLRLGLHAKGGR